MSRAKLPDNLNAVQLFPFVAVLLCTMGSLLVLLVGVARSSRNQAHEAAAAVKSRAAAPQANDETVRRKLRKVVAHVAELKHFGMQANEQLRNDQLQLSHLEDHMRRLQAQLDSLRIAAVELNSLEDAHYDDREQGQRELSRLQELIAERHKAIDELQNEQGTKRRSYAILPTTSPNGTRRPPVCFECRGSGVYLQPEGICFTEDDFRGPPGPGNPIAAAFRAAREHLVQQNEAAGSDDMSEPYALVVVRPGGQAAFQEVLRVLEASGIDFGYEIIELDAAINYPPANPQLFGAEQQAILTARGRMEMLALAAPEAYGSEPESYDEGDGDDDDDDDDDVESYAEDDEAIVEIDGTDSSVDRKGSKLAVDSHAIHPVGGGVRASRVGGYEDAGSMYVMTEPGGGGPHGIAHGPTPGTQGRAGAPIDGESATAGDSAPNGMATGSSPSHGVPSAINAPAGNQRGSGTSISGGSQFGDGLPNNGPPPAGGSIPNGQPAGTSSPRFGEYDPNALPANQRSHEASSALGNSPGREMGDGPTGDDGDPHNNQLDEGAGQARKSKKKLRGKDWAIRDRTPGSVSIRRTIRVAVRGDSLAVLPEQGVNEVAAAGREVPLVGPTALARDEFATAIESHIQEWGMAGQGLHWRPVIEMVVGPDGQHRADDLVRLLKGSGIEVKQDAVAQNVEGGNARASR